MPLLSRSTIRSLRVITAAKSSPTLSAVIPNSLRFLKSSNRSAVWSSAFVGMQPRWRQVPPQPAGSRSTTAVLSPICAARTAAT